MILSSIGRATSGTMSGFMANVSPFAVNQSTAAVLNRWLSILVASTAYVPRENHRSSGNSNPAQATVLSRIRIASTLNSCQ